MPSDFTRRNFLKLSGLGSLAAVTGLPERAFSLPTANPTPSSQISAWVTTDDTKLAASTLPAWQASSAPAASDAIILNPDKKLQPILGFGAAFTDAACYMFNQLAADSRAQLFHTLFHPSEMALNVCRTCIGSSDYSTKVYSFDEGEPDPDLKRFSIDHDKEYILPMLREARKANPDLFLFSSPWSPPGWMKANLSMLGGSMRRKYMSSYANYFLKFLQGYEAEGVPVQAITVQNEVDTDQDGRMPACIWPQEYEADFVRQNLGPTLERAGSKTKIWIIDHNYNLWGRAAAELETPGVRKYTNAVAWHGYVGQPEWVARVHDLYPDVEMYWTEGGPDYTDPNYAKEWCSWSQTFATVLRNWCRSITGWNLALDEKGRPNIGPFNCGGMVTINSQTKAITYSGQFWAFAHYSRFIRRGAIRFDSQGGASGVSHAAFENTDRKRILVLTNPGAARSCELRIGDMVTSISVAANSITTIQWT